MKKQIVIIKLGTNVVTTRRHDVDMFRLGHVADQIRQLHKENFQVVLVVSGAIAAGLAATKLKSAVKSVDKRMAAGVGQAKLFSRLWTVFKQKKIAVSQLLLTRQDLLDPHRSQEIKKIIQKTVDMRIVPVLNENDVLSLYSFGGNDFLAEKIGHLISTSCLIILTDVDGFLDLPPNSTLKNISRAKVIPEISHLTDELKQKILPTTVKNGVGGMQAKVEVAGNLQRRGVKTIIANGKMRDILTRLLIGEEKIGTHFTVKKNPFPDRR